MLQAPAAVSSLHMESNSLDRKRSHWEWAGEDKTPHSGPGFKEEVPSSPQNTP